MKKCFLSVIFVGILGVSNPLFAEESGWFVGTQLSKGGVNLGYRYCVIYATNLVNDNGSSITPYPIREERCFVEPRQPEHFKKSYEFLVGEEHKLKGIKYGFLGGYKQFFTADFGLRYYVAFDMAKYQYDGAAYMYSDDAMNYGKWELRTKYTHKINERHFSVNVDALYNFIANDTLDFGVFVGVSLGYVIYKYDMNEGLNHYYGERGYKQIDKMQDFNIGLI